jgi:hypothetical protein
MEYIYRGKYFLFLLMSLLIVEEVNAQDYLMYNPPSTFLSYNSLKYKQFSPPILELQKSEKKSVAQAFFYSLLLPGMGEAYVGKYGYTKFFLSVELVGWGFYLANRMRVNSREQDYKNFATQHAGVKNASKDDQYWIDIGKYDNIYEYNEQRRRERDISAIYEENAMNYWRWDNYDNRLFYDGRRIETREIERREVFIIGAVVLNHLVSAINALRLAKAYNRGVEQLSWNFNVNLNPTFQNFSLSLIKSF